MRGEETQLLGAAVEGLAILPGTHSKWMTVDRGTVRSIRTSMTGELFSVLKRHSLLRTLIVDGPGDTAAFDLGVVRAR